MENSLAVKGHLKEFLMRDPKKIVQTEYAKHLATLEGIVNNLKTDHHPLCDQLKLFINSEQERALQFVGKLEADALKLEWFNAGQKIHN